MLGNTISEAYQNGYNAAELHRLDMELIYLNHLRDMLSTDMSLSPFVVDSLDRQIGMLFTQLSDLKKAKGA